MFDKFEFLSVEDLRWDEILTNFEYDIYHKSNFLKVECQNNLSRPQALFVEHKEKQCFIPYLLRSCDEFSQKINKKGWLDISSPYGYPAPLFNKTARGDQGFLKEVLRQWLERLKKVEVCSIFLRFNPLLDSGKDIWREYGNLKYEGDTVFIDLKQDIDLIWHNLRKNYRYEIERLRKLPDIEIKYDWEYLDDFINLYYQTMNKVMASRYYYFSKDYFYSLRTSLNKNIHLLTIILNKEILSSALFFETEGIVQYHLSASSDKFTSISPTKLLLYEAMRYFKDRGNRVLHLGGGLGGKKDNLYNFKAGFSKNVVPFYTWRAIVDEDKVKELMRARDLVYSKKIDMDSYFPPYRE